MILAGVPVPQSAIADLVSMVRAAGADDLAVRLQQGVGDGVTLLALTIDERAVILNALDDPSDDLAELRAMLVQEHEWRQAQGLG